MSASHDKTAARRASRQAERIKTSSLASAAPEERLHGAVFGRLDNGDYWAVHFPTTDEAERFLRLLGPPPATKARLDAAMAALREGAGSA
jgi:hypothetical protein